MSINEGYDPKEIQVLQEEIAETGNLFVFKEEYEPNEEYGEFLFIGTHEGKPVVFDCIMYLLSVSYENKLLEEAEALASKQNPAWAAIIDAGNETEYPEDLEDFIAYTLVDLEEDEAVMVKEAVELDFNFEFGIGMEVSLNLDAIIPAEINEFISQYNDGTFEPDPTLYSFEEEEEED